MNVRTASRPWSRPGRGRRAAVAAAVVALGLAGLTACDSGRDAGRTFITLLREIVVIVVLLD